MDFDSFDYSHSESQYGAVRIRPGKGSGNSEELFIEFEVPSGFAQPMEVTVMTGDMPSNQQIYRIEDVHTVRMKIVGEWEGSEILHALAAFVHAKKLEVILE